MSGKCKDCRWWQEIGDPHGNTPGVCRKAGDHTQQKDRDGSLRADGFYAVYGDRPADLVTGPDFGCNHFEAK